MGGLHPAVGMPPGGGGLHPGGSASRVVGQNSPLILRDTVNKRTVGILLECILVL